LKVSIYVSPKKGVLDPAGQAALGALRSLGFGEVADVQIGKYIILSLDDVESGKVEARVQEMCERLLANPIIEDYRIEAE
jgi:phosphoribosylformylglycinamidine synthase subunit PurS